MSSPGTCERLRSRPRPVLSLLVSANRQNRRPGWVSTIGRSSDRLVVLSWSQLLIAARRSERPRPDECLAGDRAPVVVPVSDCPASTSAARVGGLSRCGRMSAHRCPPISVCCFSRLRESCPTTTAAARRSGRVVRVGRPEKSLPTAFLWMLAAEPDVDPARVPEATGAPIRCHRRGDRNRLDRVCDQPSPSR
jgi:hypothetical protein